MEQRSIEWHSFRARRIGGSDAPIICGWSPWKDALTLFLEKTGKIQQPDSSGNFAIQRGIRLEPMVRAMVEMKLDLDFPDSILVHEEKPYLMASLDGWNAEKRILLEIKIGNKKDHDRGIVPDKYYPQLQHQMYVTDTQFAYYASYYLEKSAEDQHGHLNIIELKRDEEFLAAYLPMADRFYEALVNNKPPEVAKINFLRSHAF